MAELKHQKCGGVISVDIADQFTLRTHSIIITPSEVKLGVMELDLKPRGGNTVFVCRKCETKFDEESNFEGMAATCLVCSKQKPVSQLWTSFIFPCICADCKGEISGEGTDKREKSKLAECFDLSLSSYSFTKFIDVLKKPIS